MGCARPREGLVFALSGTLDFSYARSDELFPPVYLVGRGPDLEEQYLTNVGAQFEIRATDDGDLGWKWVTDQLDRRTPVMVWADIAHLPYLRARLSMSRHDIVITGYDDDRGVALVVDNDRDSVQLVPYEDLRRARSSTGFPVPTRHTAYIVDWPTTAPDLAAIAGPALIRSAQAMAAITDSRGLTVTRDPEAQKDGLDGVEHFAVDVAAWPDALDDHNLESALFALWAFIEKAGTEGVVQGPAGRRLSKHRQLAAFRSRPGGVEGCSGGVDRLDRSSPDGLQPRHPHCGLAPPPLRPQPSVCLTPKSGSRNRSSPPEQL